MWHKLVALILLLWLLIPSGSVLAQDYYFSLPKETVDVYWNPDGTESIDIKFLFDNPPFRPAIEFVDVGIPNSNFKLSNIQADVDGQPVGVSINDYQGSGSGVAIVLGKYSIQAGSKGTVRIFIDKISQVLYRDDRDQNYASAVYGTTYFGEKYVSGSTNLTVTFHLPKDVKQEELRWHAAPEGFNEVPYGFLYLDGTITYSWNNPHAYAYNQYSFGTSFPKRYVPQGTIIVISPLEKFANAVSKFIANNWLAILIIVLAVFVVGTIIINTAGKELLSNAIAKRRMQYLPPKITIEGYGIKRGLTAVEAAILMQLPLEKVLTLILFGLAKKKALQVISRTPLEIHPLETESSELYPYEKAFLAGFEVDGRDRRAALEKTVVDLINSVNKKMAGFSYKESAAYYQGIMAQAWKQVEDAQTPEVKSEKFDEGMEWIVLDEDYNDRTQKVFYNKDVKVPNWWEYFDPLYARELANRIPSASVQRTDSPGGGISLPDLPSGGFSRPNLPGGEFAASIASGMQNFSGDVAAYLSDFTRSITEKTNPLTRTSAAMFSTAEKITSAAANVADTAGKIGSATANAIDSAIEAAASGENSSGGGSHRSGGGRSCACACACAGCACACAGGGR